MKNPDIDGFARLRTLIDLMKFQISNPKYQKNPNDQNSKNQTTSRAGGFWSFNIEI
jgi:hypothetical protein